MKIKKTEKTKLSKMTIIICVVTILFACISISVDNSMQRTAEDAYSHPYTSSNSARGMRSRLLDMKQFVDIFLSYNFENAEDTRALFQARYDMQAEAIKAIYESYSGPREDVDKLQAAMDELIAQQDKAVDFAVDHNQTEILNYLEDNVYPKYDLVSACLTPIIDFADSKIYELTKRSRQTATLSTTASLLLSTGIIFLSIYSSRMEQKNIKVLITREQELQDALILAQKASSVKKDFLSCMSHEIRTPLNVIIGMTTIAGAHLEDPVRVEDCLSKITFSSRHLLSIINDVLDMSKIEEGKFSVSHEPFQLHQLMESLISTVYSQVSGQGMQFECDTKGVTTETYIGDYMRVNQILLNLLSNAIKFTPEGGTIRLSVKTTSMDGGKTGLLFTVSDTGIGMSNEFLERIFMPFEQADTSTSRKYGGTGLGLAITHNLVELLNGTIRVESKLQKGTTFTVNLPFDIPENEEHKKWEFGALKVLIADNAEDTCCHTGLLLKRMSIEAEWVNHGDTAVQIILNAHEAGEDYHVCIIDWKMSDIDGVEVTRRIRDHLGPETLIIILSAYDWTAIENEARLAGVNAFISKPLFESNLYNTLLSTVKKPTVQDIKSPPHSTSPEFSGMRFLLVEDNVLNREIMFELLKVTTAEIDCAENGKEALDKILDSPAGYYNLVIMDIQMPVMDGYEATKRIRSSAHPDARSLPILAMTANAFKDDVEKALDSGVNAHMAKPIDIKVLYQMLENVLK